jgi:hypothetical protein
MTYSPHRHHRRSIRLQDYNYARAGAYFITLCTHERACLLGEVAGDEVVLSEEGAIVQEEWLCSAEIRREIDTRAYSYSEVTDELLDEVVRRIKAVGDPHKIVLFGSRARGETRVDSDLDLGYGLGYRRGGRTLRKG